MRNLRKAVTMMGLVAGTTSAAAFFAVGCSGDDNVTDGGKDGTLDQMGPDVVSDTVQPDVTLDSPSDAGPDVNVFDQFRKEVAQKFCARFVGCCNNMDAGPFDQAKCEQAVTNYGWALSNAELSNPEVLNGPNLKLDNTAAQACLSGLMTFSCPIITSGEQKTVTDNCVNAITGNLPVGSACIKTVECMKGEYCDFAQDAGKTDGGSALGKCANVLGQGVKCGAPPYGASFSSQECAYKGWQMPAMFCSYDSYPDAGGYACAALRANGVKCYFDNECTTGLCNPPDAGALCGSGTCTCQGSKNIATTVCTQFKDAGPG